MYTEKVKWKPDEAALCLNEAFPDGLEAVIFDLDGTLADTECLYRRFWVEAARDLGFPMEDRHALMIRSMSPAYAEPLLRREVCENFDYHAVRAHRRVIMEAFIDEHGVKPKAGARLALETAKKLGVRTGLATATPEARAKKVLKLLGLEEYLDAYACGDMVQKGKPEPDLYLLALQKLGAAPTRSIGVEDSPTGIRSAKAAGLFPVMIPDQDEPGEHVKAACGLVLPSLAALADAMQKAKR